jgi:DNA-binding response OmpR family regulator
MPKILIIEDEPNMGLGLADNLEFEGYLVELAADGAMGLQKAQQGSYDLILLDVMLPNLSGFDICKTLRQQGNKVPVILLTAKGDELSKVRGLELGADDYMTKPFSLRELLARIKAILRRVQPAQPNADTPGPVPIGQLRVDFQAYEAFLQGTPVKMSHKEFEILRYLWQRRNETVSRNDLLEQVWGYEAFPTTRTVDNFILKIRQKVEEDANHPRIILTVHGVGYKLKSANP